MDITRDQDESGLRWYTDGDVSVMSVTTVLKFLEEDTTGLERWQNKNDGGGDRPHHEHIFWYSGPRGTLCHYHALSQYEEAFDGEDMWGEEESESLAKLHNGPEGPEPCPEHDQYQEDCKFCYDGEFEDASTDPADVVYSLMKDKGIVADRSQYEALFEGNTRLVDLMDEDREYFVEKFDTLTDELGITAENVIAVEKYLLNDDVGYGGQCDLIYEAPDGAVVVVDLKTSSSLREKHRLQSVAYSRAVEQADGLPDSVDRVEVWRISPSRETWQIHSHEVPEHAEHLYDADEPEGSTYTDAYWLSDKWGDFEYDSTEEMWETFVGLVETAHSEASTTGEEDGGD